MLYHVETFTYKEPAGISRNLVMKWIRQMFLSKGAEFPSMPDPGPTFNEHTLLALYLSENTRKQRFLLKFVNCMRVKTINEADKIQQKIKEKTMKVKKMKEELHVTRVSS